MPQFNIGQLVLGLAVQAVSGLIQHLFESHGVEQHCIDETKRVVKETIEKNASDHNTKLGDANNEIPPAATDLV